MIASVDPASSSLIDPAQIDQFRTLGYCCVDGLFSEAEIAVIEAFFEDYKKNGEAVYDGGSRFEEIDPAKRQVRAMHPHRHSARALRWALHPRVLAVLEVLMGRPPLLAQTMYYFKPPGAKGQGMHQDNFYLLAAPSTCMAAWTAIDAATVENGCLYVVPESHRREILCPKTQEALASWFEYGDSHIRPFPREFRPVPVEVPRGSTFFFNGQLVHGSGPNRSPDRSRRTFIGHYIDSASEQVARFYHPVLDAAGRTVEGVRAPEGGGPCGDGWTGAVH